MPNVQQKEMGEIMSSLSWWRSWHGAPTDHKWPVIAARSGVKVGIVSAIAWALFDYASQHAERGTVDGFDTEEYAVYSGFSEDEIKAVIKAMTDKGIITGGKLTNWELHEKPEALRPSPEVWKVIRARIFKRDNYTCQYCGRSGVRLECDHVIPVAQGGSSDDGNLATACFDCNRSKRDKTPDEWGRHGTN